MKNIVIEIDGVRHKLTQNYSTCDKCSLQEICDDNYYQALCSCLSSESNTMFELEN